MVADTLFANKAMIELAARTGYAVTDKPRGCRAREAGEEA